MILPATYLVRHWQKGRLPGFRPTWFELKLANDFDRIDEKRKAKIAATANTIKIAR